MSSAKYHIGIPWLYNRGADFGVFFNQPGDGTIDLTHAAGGGQGQGGGVTASFACQKQLDMWVAVAPAPTSTGAGAGVSANPAAAVYSRYAHATGLPSPLPPKAALFWQSRDACVCPVNVTPALSLVSFRSHT